MPTNLLPFQTLNIQAIQRPSANDELFTFVMDSMNSKPIAYFSFLNHEGYKLRLTFPGTCIDEVCEDTALGGITKLWVNKLRFDAPNDLVTDYLKAKRGFNDIQLSNPIHNLQHLLWFICKDLRDLYLGEDS